MQARHAHPSDSRHGPWASRRSLDLCNNDMRRLSGSGKPGGAKLARKSRGATGHRQGVVSLPRNPGAPLAADGVVSLPGNPGAPQATGGCKAHQEIQGRHRPQVCVCVGLPELKGRGLLSLPGNPGAPLAAGHAMLPFSTVHAAWLLSLSVTPFEVLKRLV
eukprot:1089273-Pelagomonas_calceolata.AAC.1